MLLDHNTIILIFSRGWNNEHLLFRLGLCEAIQSCFHWSHRLHMCAVVLLLILIFALLLRLIFRNIIRTDYLRFESYRGLCLNHPGYRVTEIPLGLRSGQALNVFTHKLEYSLLILLPSIQGLFLLWVSKFEFYSFIIATFDLRTLSCWDWSNPCISFQLILFKLWSEEVRRMCFISLTWRTYWIEIILLLFENEWIWLL